MVATAADPDNLSDRLGCDTAPSLPSPRYNAAPAIPLAGEEFPNGTAVVALTLLQELRLDPKPPRLHLPLDDATRAVLAGWVREHWDNVFGHLYRLSGKRHVAEDLAQETFLRAGQQFRSFKAGTNLRAWLMRIATNAFLDSRRRATVAKSDPITEDTAAPVQTMTVADAKELNEALTAALAELPETARAVFLLRAREELSFREIAETIGSTEETARWHMLQARRKLMQRMDGWL